MSLRIAFFGISSWNYKDQPTSPYLRTIGKVGTTSGSDTTPAEQRREPTEEMGAGWVDADVTVSAHPEPTAARHEREEALDDV